MKRVLAALTTFTFAVAINAAHIDCSDPSKLTAGIKELCRQLSAVSATQQYLLPVSPVSDIYRAARQRIAAGDDTLAARVSIYEQRWLAAERVRREVNDRMTEELDALRSRGIQISEQSIGKHVSAGLQQRIADYRTLQRLTEDIWRPQPLPESEKERRVLAWVDVPSDDQRMRDPDLVAANRILDDHTRQSRERAKNSDRYADLSAFARTELENQVNSDAARVAPAPQTRDRVDSGRLQRPNDDPGRGGGVPAPGDQPGQTPPPPGQPQPDNGGLPPAPQPGGPIPRPGGPPGPNPNPAPGAPAPSTGCITDQDMARIQSIYQEMMQALSSYMNGSDEAKLAQLQQKNCDTYRAIKAKCPVEYAEWEKAMQDAIRQAGRPDMAGGFSLEQIVCTPIGKGGTSPHGPKQMDAIVEPCDNGGFECTEQQARMANICVDGIPDGANVNIRLFTKFVEEANFEEVKVGHDARWARFVTAAVQDGKACATFENWSHVKRRVIRIVANW